MALARPWARKAQQLFTPAEQAQLQPWLEDIDARLNLHRSFAIPLMEDHILAVRWYLDHGLTLSEAMARLNPAQLGDFYLRERQEWYPLDTAAKVYPLSMGVKRMMIFRVSFYLQKPVEPVILQMALNYVVRRFPYFATTIKCGFFWHYIDSAMRRYAVKPEAKLPCAPIRLNASASPTFRVIYFGNRVSVEFFHILTDGTGAMIFLRTLLWEYLRLLGHPLPPAEGVFNLNEQPDPREWADDFPLADPSSAAEGFGDKAALQLRGLPPLEHPNRVLHFNLSVAALRAQAKEKGVTLTVLLLGYLMLALRDAAEPFGGKKKLQVQLPVNMRKFYPSSTLRNFSMYCSIRLHPRQITTLDDILPLLAQQVAEGGRKENLDSTMNLSRKLVRGLSLVPLVVKRPIAYLIYGHLSDGVFTTTFSNLGAVQLPEEAAAYVDKFDFVLGPPVRNKAVCSLCSYGDKAVLTLVKNTTSTVLEDALYRYLAPLHPFMEGTA